MTAWALSTALSRSGKQHTAAEIASGTAYNRNATWEVRRGRRHDICRTKRTPYSHASVIRVVPSKAPHLSDDPQCNKGRAQLGSSPQ